MAEYEKKHGDFALFPVRNRKSDKAPTHSGNIFLSGKTYNLAAWEKLSKSGGKYMSGRIGDEIIPDQQAASGVQATMSRGTAKPELDDEIPF